jgi:hypothetical protein
MSQKEIEQEKKKLEAIIAEKEAWHKWDNSTPPRVMEKAVKELERMGEEFEKDSKRELIQQQRAKPKQQRQQQQSSESPLANLSLEDMMASSYQATIQFQTSSIARAFGP